VNGFATSFGGIVEALKALRPAADVGFTPSGPPIDYPLVDASRIERETGFRPRYDLDAAVEAYLQALGEGTR
jgi:nucleoside-diphosphate-sugar epimerase